MNTKKNKEFVKLIKDFYKKYRRSFPWREEHTEYNVFVSEVMLQQTQTYRVLPKYEEFLQIFPNFKTLADAQMPQLLAAWRGLGYNRRALYLQRSAQIIIEKHNGHLPNAVSQMQELPGIGYNTACSVLTLAFNIPTAFIETNIRTVYIYHYFKNAEKVHDNELKPIIEETLDIKNPRDWYYALMDYGVWLKQNKMNYNAKSSHYRKQSKFQGSDRQIRGNILKHLTELEKVSFKDLVKLLETEEERLIKILQIMEKEGFLRYIDDIIILAE